jgi:hypothetical protein
MADIPKNAKEFAEQINEECVALVSPGSTPTKSFLLAKCAELITARDAEREQLVAAAAMERAIADLKAKWGHCDWWTDDICNPIRALIPDAGKLLAERERDVREALEHMLALFDDEGNFSEEFEDQTSIAIEKASAALRKG